MTGENSVGRIHKNVFVISTSILFGFAILGVAIRVLIRFYLRREKLLIDDVFILVAFALLLSSFVILHQELIEPLYLIVAVQNGVQGIVSPTDLRDVSQKYRDWSAVWLTAVWCGYSAAKLGFLFFFKRLIDSFRYWLIYWWAVIIFSLATSAYGVVVVFIDCPYFVSKKQCKSKTFIDLSSAIESITLMVADTIGDLLVLVIPFYVIWRIRVQLQQKIVLTFSLCLTVVMIALSIIRVCGLTHDGVTDAIWQMYWQFLQAEVGVFLAAAVAFRSFFLTRKAPVAPAHSVKRGFIQSWARARRHHHHPNSIPDSRDQITGAELDSLPLNTASGPDNAREMPRLSEHDSKAESIT